MKRILFITLIGAMSFTTSCAHKKSTTPSDVVTVEAAAEKKQQPKELAKNTLEKEDTNLSYNCLVAGDKRTVILNKETKKCTVNYTKEGNTNEVAWGESRPEICQAAFDKIRTNIESAGFKCNAGLETEKKTTEKKTMETASTL